MDGLDCYGLVISIYAEAGITLFDIDDEYEAKEFWRKRNYFLENHHRQWREVKTPQFLDVIYFKNAAGVGNHIGIYLDGGTFIHTLKAGTVVGKMSVWKDKVVGYYRNKLL